MLTRFLEWLKSEVGGLNSPTLVIIGTVPVLSWASIIMQENGYLATTVFPILVFLLSLFAMASWWIGRQDRWLGLLCGWWVLSLFWTRTPQAFETTMLSVVGCVVICLVRGLPAVHRKLAVRLVEIGAVAIALIALIQATGFDPVWWTEYGSVGTLGNSAYVACLMAVVVPFATTWTVPILLGALVVTKASLPMLAAMIGLAWRFRRWAWVYTALALPAMGAMVWMRGADLFLASQQFRLDVWGMAWKQMTWKAWLIGHGPGSWFDLVPHLQDLLGVHPHYYFTYAHNEYLQLVWEGGGLVAGGLLLLWLWDHRTMFRSPYAGSVIAILVLSVGWFIFHLSNIAPTLLIILSVATAWQPVTPVSEQAVRGYRRALHMKGYAHV